MRQRKVYMTLLLILGVLLLGVAYAAITTQGLNVTGNAIASASDENFSVVFSGSPVITKPTLADGSEMTDATVETSINGKTATLNVAGLNARGQTVTAEFTVINNSADLGAELSDANVSYDNTTWYSIDAELSTKTLTANGGTATLTVTITLLDTPANDLEASAASEEFTISFTADPT